MPIERTLWRVWLRTRFTLFQRHRFNRLVVERVAGRSFVVLPGVFNPTLFFTSEFLATALTPRLVPPGSQVLDMGTGSGVGAVFAAHIARMPHPGEGAAGHVTAVDINPAAVRCARINVILNEVEPWVDVHEGDLFAPITGRRFDVILFNPPYLPGEPANTLDRAFRSTEVLDRFADEADAHLSPDGHVLLLLSSEAPVAAVLRQFEVHGFLHELVAERNLISERLWLHRLHR